jgi:hypothetical protein
VFPDTVHDDGSTKAGRPRRDRRFCFTTKVTKNQEGFKAGRLRRDRRCTGFVVLVLGKTLQQTSFLPHFSEQNNLSSRISPRESPH